MTIALGIIATDGFVIAADTHESLGGYWKLSQGKVSASIHVVESGADSLFITGAGHGHHLDAIAKRLLKRFGESLSLPVLERKEALALVVSEFYAMHVLPLAAMPQVERPEFQLLLGYRMAGSTGLLLSEHTVLDEHTLYAAVGVGSTLAYTLLNRFYKLPIVDVRGAILLAAYVMFHVKDSFEGCGKSTDVMGIRGHGSGFVFLDRKVTAQLEDAIQEYCFTTEPYALRRLMGLSSPHHVSSDVVARRAARRAEATIKKLLAKVV